MNYWKLEVACAHEWRDILQAYFGNWPFNVFEDTEKGFDAYFESTDWPPYLEEEIVDLQKNFPFEFQRLAIPSKNWNEEWEKHFAPVIVDDFCVIRADFHPSFPDATHELRINPKMAFGTGHHETTRMMIQSMRSLDFDGQTVLDYGAGTGILAILAAKMGARSVHAVEIEPPAYENALENFQTNETPFIMAYLGTLEMVPEMEFDIILANINRNVILNSLDSLKRRLKPQGQLIISGFLKEDKDLLLGQLSKAGFLIKKELADGKWICLHTEKNEPLRIF